jgi:hypothetical protein
MIITKHKTLGKLKLITLADALYSPVPRHLGCTDDV